MKKYTLKAFLFFLIITTTSFFVYNRSLLKKELEFKQKETFIEKVDMSNAGKYTSKEDVDRDSIDCSLVLEPQGKDLCERYKKEGGSIYTKLYLDISNKSDCSLVLEPAGKQACLDFKTNVKTFIKYQSLSNKEKIDYDCSKILDKKMIKVCEDFKNN